MTPILYLVVPCYNEEEIIAESEKKLMNKLNDLIVGQIISEKSKLVFVNDGSEDKTFEILYEKCKVNKKEVIISFTKNFGHQNAILAGMLYAKKHADAVITIDADLQQDINAIEKFINSFIHGNDVIYGVRNDRKTDNILKKITANVFYWLMQSLGCNVIADSADYRLMSKRALETLSEYTETNLFLRGLIPLMGFKSDIVYFDVKARTGGRSKYNIKKMVSLAVNGITSLSVRPIRLVIGLGAIMCLFSIVMIIFSLLTWKSEGTLPGYTTTVISIWLVGGTILLSQGIIGEYIGKMYFEVKKRPRFIIETIIQGGEDESIRNY